MTTNLEKQIQAAATVLQAQTALTPEQATELAKAVIAATADDNEKAPAPAPAGRPVAPRLPDMTGMSPAERSAAWRKQEQDLAAWHHFSQSYVEPISDAAIAAKARLLELRAASEADTDAEKVRRAMERQRLCEIIQANGMVRL